MALFEASQAGLAHPHGLLGLREEETLLEALSEGLPHPTKHEGYFLLGPAVTAPLPSPDPTHQPASLSLSCPGVPIPGSSVLWTVTSLRTETEQLGGNGRPLRSARPAPRVPGAERGDVRPLSQGLLVPRTATQCPTVEPLNWGVLLVWEWLPGHLEPPSEATHVLTFLRDSPLFTV